MVHNKIEQWVQLALEHQEIFNYTVSLSGKTSKDDGYLGNIYFVSVKGENKKGCKETINLVIKASKESRKLREQTPIKKSFEKEILLYSRILKSFKDFQEEMGCENFLDLIPHCYATKILKDSELLIFDDLKPQGYSVLDRKKPMTYEHIQMVLEAYGKWHAFSFALKMKKRDVFENLMQKTGNLFCYFFEKTGMIDITWDDFQNSRNRAILLEEVDILNKLQFSKKDAYYIFKDLLQEDPDYHVITHSDCWNNNYLFKHGRDQKPESVRILDWQCTGLSSPVMDLSHFIYCCSDTGKYRNMSTLLKIYHNSLSQCLVSLGCDPDELFPYSKLVEHWKRFSKYGILLQGFILKFALCDVEDAPDFAEAAEKGQDFLDNFNIKVNDEEEYCRRVRNNLLHYVQNLDLQQEI